MQHRLSVTESLPKECIPVLCGIEVENNGEGITFTSCSPDEMKKLKRMLSFSLADLITGEYEKKRLLDRIMVHHPYLLAEERREVLRNASLVIERMPSDKRIHYIEDKLYAFLKDSDVLSLEGFINFRLKEYRKQLDFAVDEAAQDYLAEKEYEEFISLLKYFVLMQPAVLSRLHIVFREDGSFLLCDGAFRNVTEKLQTDFLGKETAMLSPDDILISLLITLSPEEIVLHKAQHSQNKNMVETIFKVFGRRVRFCEMCPQCENAD